MLKPGTTYRDNQGDKVTIGGRIKRYSADRPWVYSIQANWYDEFSGARVTWASRTGHSLLPTRNLKSISDHRPINPDTGNLI